MVLVDAVVINLLSFGLIGMFVGADKTMFDGGRGLIEDRGLGGEDSRVRLNLPLASRQQWLEHSGDNLLLRLEVILR